MRLWKALYPAKREVLKRRVVDPDVANNQSGILRNKLVLAAKFALQIGEREYAAVRVQDPCIKIVVGSESGR